MDITGIPHSTFGDDSEISLTNAQLSVLSGFDGFKFNPQACIILVNFLHSLGFERSLEILGFFLQTADNFEFYNPENVLLVSRLLYTAKNQEEPIPRLILGTPDIKKLNDPSIFPLFPLTLQHDLPLLLVGGYRAGGEAEPPTENLEWYALHGQLRATPLMPQYCPMDSVDEFIKTTWRLLNSDPWHAGMIRLQALRSVSHIIPLSRIEEQALLSASTSESVWSEVKPRFEELNIRWDSKTNEYAPNPN